MLQRLALLLLAAAMVLGGAWWMSRGGPGKDQPAPPSRVAAPAPTPAPASAPAASQAAPWVAGPGRVEPISEEMRLGFGMTGVLREVLVEEGDRVRQGQVLARLAADELAARVAAAEQALAAAEAAVTETTAGTRDTAMAEVGEARARLEEARALAEKGVIRSPIDGVVLRKHRRAGEMVSVSFDTPVVTVGDVSRLRVRADVDERDIARIAVGQKAILMAEAYGDRRFLGHVSRVAGILGKKNVRTDDPAEKNDTRILETLVDVDEPAELPVGLRMDVFIITAPGGDERLPAYHP